MPRLNPEISHILATSRPAFLLLPLSCLLLPLAYAISQGISINWLHVLFIVTGALAAHISVNMLNEYEDFKSGLDFHTQRTPFSGGSGILPAFPELAESVRIAAMACLLITVLIGLVFSVGQWLGPFSAGLFRHFADLLLYPENYPLAVALFNCTGLGFWPLDDVWSLLYFKRSF